MRLDTGTDRFRALDDAALYNALLALRTCPNCRRDLQPVAFLADVFGCSSCRETWHLPNVNEGRPEEL